MKRSGFKRRARQWSTNPNSRARRRQRAKLRRTNSFGDDYAPWVASHPCDACGRKGPCDPAHVDGIGAGGNRPAGFWRNNMVSLCRASWLPGGGCHRQCDQGKQGKEQFIRQHNLREKARRYTQRWDESKGQGGPGNEPGQHSKQDGQRPDF